MCPSGRLLAPVVDEVQRKDVQGEPGEGHLEHHFERIDHETRHGPQQEQAQREVDQQLQRQCRGHISVPPSGFDLQPVAWAKPEGPLRAIRLSSECNELSTDGTCSRRIFEHLGDTRTRCQGVVLGEHALGGEFLHHLAVRRLDADRDGCLGLATLEGQHLELRLFRRLVEQRLSVAATRLAALLGLGDSGDAACGGHQCLNPQENTRGEQCLVLTSFEESHGPLHS